MTRQESKSLLIKGGHVIDPAAKIYLRATEIEVGLLFNFGPNAQFKHYVFENAKKNPRNPRESAEKKSAGSCG
jgi:hypothetical protein